MLGIAIVAYCTEIKQTPVKKIRLVQCGWYANEHIEAAFNDAARALCPSVLLQHAEGRDPVARRNAWASADIFVSLADNIQETFGLTPIEAMAAGLPVIVSDWDGYKDTVRDGVDGYRIPTVMPQAGSGIDLAQRYANGTDTYDFHCGLASQFVALDAKILSQALERLIADPEQRRSMGEAARKRACADYDWAVIYRRYQLLWGELAERRRADPDLHPPISITARPDRPDPFAAFGAYATTQIGPNHVVTLRDEASSLGLRRALTLNTFAQALQPGEKECMAIVSLFVERNPQSVSSIAEQFPNMPAWKLQRNLVWLTKMDVLQIDTVL